MAITASLTVTDQNSAGIKYPVMFSSDSTSIESNLVRVTRGYILRFKVYALHPDVVIKAKWVKIKATDKLEGPCGCENMYFTSSVDALYEKDYACGTKFIQPCDDIVDFVGDGFYKFYLYSATITDEDELLATLDDTFVEAEIISANERGNYPYFGEH